ncbi:hypothetical protein C8J57DRAFT_1431486 [Mycena rebaudengoi]|nr:hypothetical protein C8J57DRAFT_1431486 [Mycena rebaudengoi]
MANRPPNIQTNNIDLYPDRFSADLHRIREESRKLLALVLGQLKNRVLPPPIYDALIVKDSLGGRTFAVIAETVKGAVKLSGGRLDPSATFDDEEDEDDSRFSTDATLELMTQLKDVLIISAAQGWQIFDETYDYIFPGQRDSSSRSPFRISRNRNSLQPSGRRSRSPSPMPPTKAPELLSQCISVLASVVLEDCRFQTFSPRPSRPPNSLQALTLDIAQFLLHTHRHDPKIVSEIGFCLIPAFYTFQREMHARLLAFFEDGVIRSILEDLRRARGVPAGALATHDIDETPGMVSIRVDQVQDESEGSTGPYGWVPWSSPSTKDLSLHSTNTPQQPQAVYQLAALVPPLLAALLESVDVISGNESRVDVAHRFYRLVDLIVTAKPDTYLDVLEVVAYHAQARRSAISLISTIWPKALGHLIVGKAFPTASYMDSVTVRSRKALPMDHPYTHQFVPWHFSSRLNSHSHGSVQNGCHSCFSPIDGFGLLCPFCMCAVHFGCYDYPAGSHVAPYSDRNVQRVASFRFSLVLDAARNAERMVTLKNQHVFRLANVFTLCLCFVCSKPLWGCTAQGVHCTTCAQFAHSACVFSPTDIPRCNGNATTLDATSMTIDWSVLRQSCCEYYHDILSITKDQLGTRSHEEVSIISAVLWTQIQLMVNGVSSGSIVVMQKGRNAAHAKDHKVDEFELHRVLAWCEALLSSNTLRLSIALGDYLAQTRHEQPTHGVMYDWATLVYVASAIKAPYPLPTTSFETSTDLLNVSRVESFIEETDAALGQPFEVVPIAHLRDMLGYELLIRSDAVAQLLLSHIHHLGFFTTADLGPTLFDQDTFNKEAICSFPIPLGLDLTTNIETLVAAVEGCLTDLDLSVNEAGFLILMRKFWPNGMATEYGLKRLMRIIVTWILAEDDSLATILRDYVAKQRTLPGVRAPSEPLSWPSTQTSRVAPTSSVSNGGDYVAARKGLLNRYAVKWLLELHDQDPALYAADMYEICVEASQEGVQDVDIFKLPTQEQQKRRDADWSDRLLKCIMRLSQSSGVSFSVFDDLLLRWLDHVSAAGVFSESMPSLYRLFSRESDASQRFSVAADPTLTAEGVGATNFDPWRVVTDIASESKEGYSRCLQWLCAFAYSGVDVPVPIFQRFSSLGSEFNAGRNEMENILASLHSRLLTHILECLTVESIRLEFIRQSLGTCLLLYGCDRSRIEELALITKDEGTPFSAKKHSSLIVRNRRKLNVRAEPVTDPIVIHPKLMNVLEQYITTPVEDVSCLIAKFLNSFLNDSPYLESHEVDNFVLRNGRMLAHCAWQFYDIQKHEISAIRTSFLLRTVVVDSQPLQELLHDWLLPTGQWELRRLFRIILDVTSPAFNIEGRQWRSSVTEIFYRFFFALWADEKESLAKSPIAERVKLASFLIQLRPYFPSWKVLSWEVIIDTLLEDEYDQRNNQVLDRSSCMYLIDPIASLYGLSSSRDVVGVQSSNTDPDMAILRGSILLLSLQMIADGIQINDFSFHKIKVYLAKAIGFTDVVAVTSSGTFDVQFGDAGHIPDASLPCVNELLSVLDAPHPLTTLLVGSTLVDLSLGLFCTADLLSLPVLTLKSMVESLGIIIYKHDFEHRRMKHLQPALRRAVLRALDLMLEDISYEIRQLALVYHPGVLEAVAYLHRIHSLVAKLITLQSHNSQDALVAQAKLFIETTLTTYATNGFLMHLFKRRLDRDFFLILKEIFDANAKLRPPAESLREILLRDTIYRATENDPATFQTFVEVVHHQGYSPDLMTFVGQQLTPLTRRALECAADGVALDPAPLLLIPALLIQHNKANSREMLICTDSALRGALHRLNVDSASLSRLLHVTTSLYRKTQMDGGAVPTNPIILALFEMLGETLRLKTRTLPSTLRAIIETIVGTNDHGVDSPATTHLSLFMGLVDHAFHYLHHHNDFYAALAVGKLILQATNYNNSIFGRMSEPAERSGRPSLGVRSWNILVLAALVDPSSSCIAPMFDLLSAFSTTHHTVLRAYTSATSPTESATTDINHAYIAIKLWLLLAQRKSAADNGGNVTALMVWNELWPPFESMITVLEGDFQMGMSMTTASLTWSTVAELFIFLRCLRTPLALETTSHVAILNRLRSLGAQDSSTGKLSRALKIMTEPPPDIPADILMNQTIKDVVAAEKVRVLEARRDASRATQGR